MKGYNTLKQFVEDYNLYRVAKKIDPGRSDGQTITYLLKNKISKRLENASKQFKNMTNKNSYTSEDLMLIATHDTIRSVNSLDAFIKECFGIRYVDPSKYKKVLSSNAFKSGRLKLIYPIIPKQIETKTEFLRFVKGRGQINKLELNAIMKQICREKWINWLYELIDKQKITEREGRYL